MINIFLRLFCKHAGQPQQFEKSYHEHDFTWHCETWEECRDCHRKTNKKSFVVDLAKELAKEGMYPVIMPDKRVHGMPMNEINNLPKA